MLLSLRGSLRNENVSLGLNMYITLRYWVRDNTQFYGKLEKSYCQRFRFAETSKVLTVSVSGLRKPRKCLRSPFPVCGNLESAYGHRFRFAETSKVLTVTVSLYLKIYIILRYWVRDKIFRGVRGKLIALQGGIIAWPQHCGRLHKNAL